MKFGNVTNPGCLKIKRSWRVLGKVIEVIEKRIDECVGKIGK